MTKEDILYMHKVLLEMYDDLFAYCEEHYIKMIDGRRTALGEVRHKALIPLDGDMDIK